MPPKYSTINATREKVTDAPAWRGPWKRGQRCLMLSSGFYEWQDRPEGKQPHYIQMATQELFGFAGVWDSSTREDGVVVESCAIITMPANDFMAEIRNTKKRQPLVVRVEDRQAWLTGDTEAAAAILKRPDESWEAHAVSRRVNSPANNYPALVERWPDLL